MRYQRIDTISFEDVFGGKYAVKDLREYPVYITANTVKIKAGDRLDEITTRQEHYGDDYESDTYRLVEHNIEKLFEENFDLSKLREIQVPTL